jgi:hypothetical protein
MERLSGVLILLAMTAGCEGFVEESGPVGPQPAIPIPRPPDASAPPPPSVPAAPSAKAAEAPAPSPPSRSSDPFPRILEKLPATAELDAKHYGARLANDTGLFLPLNPKLTYRTHQDGEYIIKGVNAGVDIQKTQQRLTSMILKHRGRMGDNLSGLMTPGGEEVMFAAQDASHRIKQVGFLRGPAVSLSGRSALWLFLLDDGTMYQPGSTETVRLAAGKADTRDLRFDAAANVFYVDETQRLEVSSLDPNRSYRITLRIDGAPALIGVATVGSAGGAIKLSGNATLVRSQFVLSPGESIVQGVTRLWFSIPSTGGDDPARAVVDVRSKEASRPSLAALAFHQEGTRHR